MTTELPTIPDGHRLAIRALSADRSGGHGRWPEQHQWTPTVTSPVLCRRGWHACTDTRQVIDGGWFDQRLWLVELAGETVIGDDKVTAERARLLAPLPWDARIWACDVAERVLPIFEAAHPDDPRPRRVIETARAFTRGEVTRDVLAAANVAAYAATGAAYAAAAYAAAASAASVADAAESAESAAGAAAWFAAAAAAYHAAPADAAAWAAERRWQAGHLAATLGLTGTVLDGSLRV